jgi:hypothetical protein
MTDVPLAPDALAVMVAVPVSSAVTRPLGLTVATLASLVVQVKVGGGVMIVPSPVRAVAVS